MNSGMWYPRTCLWTVLPLLISCSHRAPRVAAADSGVSLDTFVEPPSPLDAADAPVAVDLASTRDEGDAEEIPTTEDATTCQPLAYSGGTSLLSGKIYAYCPVDPALPECKSSDVGATVYRDEACALATHQAHSDCSSPWQRAINQEYVIIIDPFGGCVWPITVDSVLDCGDHVSIAYSVTRPCGTCDGMIPSAVVIPIPNDPKPVRATATLAREECR